MSPRRRSLILLLSLAIVSEIVYVAIASLGNLRFHIPIFLGFYGISFLCYCLIATWFCSFGEKKKEVQQHTFERGFKWLLAEPTDRQILLIGIVFGVLFRLTLLYSPPSLSEDINRYVWDGKVATHGINPYEFAPDNDELSGLRDPDVYPKINHKEIPTVYPPVNQLLFQGIYKVAPNPLAFRAAFLFFDLLTILVLLAILKNLKIKLTRALLYIWNPLVIIEFACSSHVDIIGIFFLMLGLLFMVQKRTIWSTAAITFSFLSKFLAILFLPVILLIKKEKRTFVLLVFVSISLVVFLPYAGIGDQMFTGLSTYTSKWQFNSSIFALLQSAVKKMLPQNWIVNLMIDQTTMTADVVTIDTSGTDLALIISKIVIALIFVSIFFYRLVKLKRDLKNEGMTPIFKFGLIILGSFFLLNPTFHPWYLCWLVPFLTIVPNRAWLLLSGLVVLSYWILIGYEQTGIWQENTWIKFFEYLPFYAVLIYDAVKTKLKFRQL